MIYKSYEKSVFMFQIFHILRYKVGQKYDSHYDATDPDEFDPAEYDSQESHRVCEIITPLPQIMTLMAVL